MKADVSFLIQSPAKGSPQMEGGVSTRLRKRLKEGPTDNSMVFYVRL